MRMIASVKIDNDNLELAEDLISKREFSKIINYILRVYKKNLFLALDDEILKDMQELNLNGTHLLKYYKEGMAKKQAQYEALKNTLEKQA